LSLALYSIVDSRPPETESTLDSRPPETESTTLDPRP